MDRFRPFFRTARLQIAGLDRFDALCRQLAQISHPAWRSVEVGNDFVEVQLRHLGVCDLLRGIREGIGSGSPHLAKLFDAARSKDLWFVVPRAQGQSLVDRRVLRIWQQVVDQLRIPATVRLCGSTAGSVWSSDRGLKATLSLAARTRADNAALIAPLQRFAAMSGAFADTTDRQIRIQAWNKRGRGAAREPLRAIEKVAISVRRHLTRQWLRSRRELDLQYDLGVQGSKLLDVLPRGTMREVSRLGLSIACMLTFELQPRPSRASA